MSTTQGMKVKAAQLGNIVKNGEYILVYSRDGHKNIATESPLYDLRPEYDEHYSLYLNNDGTIGQLSDLYDFRYPKDCANKKPLKLADAFRKSEDFASFIRSNLSNIVRSDKVTGFNIASELKNGVWKQIERNEKKYLLTLDAKGTICQLLKLSDSWGKCDDYYQSEGLRKIRGDWWANFYIDMGNVSKEGNIEFKNGKKPVRLIKQIIKMCCPSNSIILDFFSGSATTAHAVMQLNSEDNGNRKFIMVQLPEVCEEKEEFDNICEIGKERIRRAGNKIKEDSPLTTQDLDVGFRVLKIDSTNMEDVYYTPDHIDTNDLFKNNIKSDRTGEDLLFQTMLDLGILLSSKIETKKINGKEVFCVEGNYLMACFDDSVDEKTITEIAKEKPYYFVMRDPANSKDGDSLITNFEQIFTTYSPDTVRKVL